MRGEHPGRLVAVLAAFAVMTVAFSGAAGAGSSSGTVPDAGFHIGGASVEEQKQLIDQAKALGGTWVAIGAGWTGIEPQPDSYKRPGGPGTGAFQNLEDSVRYAKERGLNVALMLTGAPAWTSEPGCDGDYRCPPTEVHLPHYADFLRDLAARVGPYVDAYSPWNEINYNFYWNRPDPAAYVRLQRAAYSALKSGDPTGTVLSGSLAPLGNTVESINSFDFLEDAYAAGLKGSVDVIAWNSYPPGAPEDEPKDEKGRPLPSVLPAQLALRGMLDKLDPGRRVWITEIAWSTCAGGCTSYRGNLGNIVDDRTQAEYLTRAWTYRRRYLADSVQRMFWFLVQDRGDGNSWFDNQGLVRSNGTRKPAYDAFVALRDRPATAPPATTTKPTTTTPTTTRPGQAPTAPTRPSQSPSTPSSPGSSPADNPASQPSDSPAAAQVATNVPASRTIGKRSAAVSRPRVLALNGKLVVTFTVKLAGGRSRVQIDGYRGRRWIKVKTVTLKRSSKLRATIRDRGYSSLRIRAQVPGSRVLGVGRIVRVPKP